MDRRESHFVSRAASRRVPASLRRIVLDQEDHERELWRNYYNTIPRVHDTASQSVVCCSSSAAAASPRSTADAEEVNISPVQLRRRRFFVVFLCQCWPTLCVVDIVSLSPRSFSVFINADSGSYFAPQHCRWVYLCRSTFTTRARLLLLQLLLLYVKRANGFCGGFPRRFETKARGRVGTNGIRMGTDGDFGSAAEEDLHSQMKRISAHKNTHTQ